MSLALAVALAQASLPFDMLPVGASPTEQIDPCPHFDQAKGPGTTRPVTSSDLVELADIGRWDPSDPISPFGISPDGKQIAFIIRRANPAANGYCQRLMVMPLDASKAPVERDRGGSLIRENYPLRNFTAIAAGWPQVIKPRWSPDGKTIAYIKRTEGTAQVWLVDAAGLAPPRQATHMPDDVEDFAWTADGAALIVATRPALREEVDAIAREASQGYLFDERFAPDMGDQPLPTRSHPLEYARWNIGDGTKRTAGPDEVALITPTRPGVVPSEARMFAVGPKGVAAWTQAIDPSKVLSPVELVLADGTGRRSSCDERLCTRVAQLWWADDGHTLYGVVRGGWARSRTSVIAWQVGQKAPRVVLDTDDMLIGCDKSGRELICAREGSTTPRRLVAINPVSGKERLIYNPNPQFGTRLRLGAVQRFHFRNAYGVECFADLVLPPGHRAGERHPLVVVQYNSVGFLRGGTGDVFPIQVLAGRGFAVLSFSRPDFLPAAKQGAAEIDVMREERKDWVDRRSTQNALEIAVQKAIDTGTVDPQRMGISGFSDGSSTVQWALINSRLFKVAVMGTCCEGPDSYPLSAGPSFQNQGREIGYRFFEPDADAFWKPMSMVANVDKIEAPILVQTSDSEYEGGLDVEAAFRRRGKPFELYVLPGEGHVKWQPAHRLAMYDRAVEWFEFWLMGRMTCDPAKAAQFDRWRKMRGAPANPVCGLSPLPDP
ncbi:MAG: Atxe2 family lasso peptide isopeptidase [Sphingomonadaceae bacterium]